MEVCIQILKKGGATTGEFELSLFELIEGKLGQPLLDNPEPFAADQLDGIGEIDPADREAKLYELLTPGKAKEKLESLFAGGKKPTLLLDFGGNLGWTKFKWERMCEPGKLGLAIYRRICISLIEEELTDPGEALIAPLRILILIGCKPEDPDVNPESELFEIKRAFGCDPRYNVKVVHGEKKEDLPGIFEAFQPHLFHFIGHGFGTEQGGDFGSLQLATKTTDASGVASWTSDGSTAETIEVTDLTDYLKGGNVRLAVLNACYSGDGEPGKLNLAGAALDAGGCLGVIAMRTKVENILACRFAAGFYGTLAKDGPEQLAQSFVDGVKAVSSHSGQGEKDWSRPRFQLRVAPSQILRFESNSANSFREDLISAPAELEPLNRFLDREEERKEFCHRDKCWLELRNKTFRKNVRISGDGKKGKSSLLRFALYMAQLRGLRPFLIDLGDRKFEDCNSAIEYLEKGGAVGTLLAQRWWDQPEPVEVRNLIQGAHPSAGALENLAKAVVSAAEKSEKGLLIAIDHFEKSRRTLPPNEWRIFVYHFVVPLLTSGRNNIHVCLGSTEAGFEREFLEVLDGYPDPARLNRSKIEELKESFQEIEVGNFDKSQIRDLVFDFVAAQSKLEVENLAACYGFVDLREDLVEPVAFWSVFEGFKKR